MLWLRLFTGSMRIYLNHSLNKHYTGGTRATIRRQFPIVRPGCWQQHKLVGTRPQGVPGPGGLSPRGPKFWSAPMGIRRLPVPPAAMKVTRASMWSSREAACACIYTRLDDSNDSQGF